MQKSSWMMSMVWMCYNLRIADHPCSCSELPTVVVNSCKSSTHSAIDVHSHFRSSHSIMLKVTEGVFFSCKVTLVSEALVTISNESLHASYSGQTWPICCSTPVHSLRECFNSKCLLNSQFRMNSTHVDCNLAN